MMRSDIFAQFGNLGLNLILISLFTCEFDFSHAHLSSVLAWYLVLDFWIC